uniref:Uncharacterized protein n=1 Tax=Tanacetum cinerariifolium TaxID=118510 RepID=A0A6L2LL80_TANCI|nr:hypothetical protein [Tanacetum cinerariifolium]
MLMFYLIVLRVSFILSTTVVTNSLIVSSVVDLRNDGREQILKLPSNHCGDVRIPTSVSIANFVTIVTGVTIVHNASTASTTSLVISISSYLSEESVGSHALRVILFGTIPTKALAAYEATRVANALEAEGQSQNDSDDDTGNGDNENGRNRNGDNGNVNSKENDRGARSVARECTYQDFMKCQLLNFKGTKGVVGLIRTIRADAAFSMSWRELMKLMAEVL